jgi:hypothetical protein
VQMVMPVQQHSTCAPHVNDCPLVLLDVLVLLVMQMVQGSMQRPTVSWSRISVMDGVQ